MYPQTRVFDPVNETADFALPLTSPYVEVDTTAAAVNADATALALVPGGYSAVYYFSKTAGANKITLLCPSGWTTPSGLDTDFDLPGSDQAVLLTWIVLYNAVRKVITVLNTEFTPSAFPLGFFQAFAGGVNPNTNTFIANSLGTGVTAALRYAIGVPWRHQQSLVYVSLNGLSDAQGLVITLFKNGVATGAAVTVPALGTGRFVISNQVDFDAADDFDINCTVGAGGTAARVSVVVTGDYSTSP